MSIAVEDVLERILSEVACAPDPTIELQLFRGSALRDARRDAAVGIALGAATGPNAFATNLHFWATGLLAFMRERGSDAEFMRSAERCLCRQMDDVETRRRLDGFRALLSDAAVFASIDEVSGGFHMYHDGNRRSVLVETPVRYIGLYWENDTVPPAFEALLHAIRDHVLGEEGSTPRDVCILAQHDSRLDDRADAIYAWEVAGERFEALNPDEVAGLARIRFVLDGSMERIEWASRTSSGVARGGRCAVRGEAADLLLESEAS